MFLKPLFQRIKQFQPTQKRAVLLAALSSLILVTAPAHADSKSLRMATTTSTYHSGLLDYLLPTFTKDTGYEVQLLVTGSGKALKMGEMGDVDIVLTHSPKAEKAFLDAEFGVDARSVMYNDFILVGPKDNPAKLSQTDSAASGLTKIADSKSVFISRGDDSGTHKKELSLWEVGSGTHDWNNYRSIGQGMGPTLNMSSELQGYTLTDRGTWLAYQEALDLAIWVQGDPALFNQYQIIRVNPKRYPDLNIDGAKALSDWIVSDKAQHLIDQFQVKGEKLFTADAKTSN
ncbi:substrate-binding domain-containing protein [Vibrio superstes]|uniref:Tungsten ABC transporter substrate-binding protein n=1 Tax=Vibrio superstes NBRC 103154 TaxID=1219062 RepID=A0A511QQS2_9VIBR|nr:substrate-binding domain-containing protein [Vibrio superstes]GEM79651.1 tungsten ABC transporter substrate-binding protein [Vibrio superstes NBRC 103154]